MKAPAKIIATLRGTDAEHDQLVEAACEAKMSLSTYIRSKLGLPRLCRGEQQAETVKEEGAE